MTVWARVVDRWHARQARRLIYASCDVMLIVAGRRFSEALTDDEEEGLVRSWGKWLQNDERLLALIDNPERTINLFLGEVIR
jgi:hypothetical protein